VLPTGSLPGVAAVIVVVAAVSYRSGSALTRAAMQQYHPQIQSTFAD
jgi:hypothetical protein